MQGAPQTGIHNMMVTPRTASERVLALMNRGVVDPDIPLLRADDLGVLRGEGVFETVLVVDGVAVELEAHLARLARSAAMLDFPAPDLPAWRACAQAAIDAWHGGSEMVLRLILTRGPETCSQGRSIDTETCSQGRSTSTETCLQGGLIGYALGTPVSPTVLAQRQHGIAAVTLTRGTVSDLAREAPWLLLGAKTLSYATNMAAIRHAERLGAHDAVFVAADGSVLEGPTSTVVVAHGTTLRTPPAELGILAGITQAALFRAAEAAGWRTRVEPLQVSDLHVADGVWLCSSVRLITRVHTLDGRPLPDAGLTDTLRGLLPLRLPNPSPRG
jgi:4-amino-4-deoxychorismate lyase